MTTQKQATLKLFHLLSGIKEEIECKSQSNPEGSARTILDFKCLNTLWEKAELEKGFWFETHDLSTVSDPEFQVDTLWGRVPSGHQSASLMIRTSRPDRPINPVYEDMNVLLPVVVEWIEFFRQRLSGFSGQLDEGYRLWQSGKTWTEIMEVLDFPSAKSVSMAIKRYALEMNLPLREGQRGRPSKI